MAWMASTTRRTPTATTPAQVADDAFLTYYFGDPAPHCPHIVTHNTGNTSQVPHERRTRRRRRRRRHRFRDRQHSAGWIPGHPAGTTYKPPRAGNSPPQSQRTQGGSLFETRPQLKSYAAAVRGGQPSSLNATACRHDWGAVSTRPLGNRDDVMSPERQPQRASAFPTVGHSSMTSPPRSGDV